MAMLTQLLLIGIGLLSGFSSGLLGIGGSTLIIPLLVLFFSFSQHQAQAAALTVLLIPLGVFAGWWSYFKADYVNWAVVALIFLGFVIGAFFGGKLAISIPEFWLKKGFALFLLIIAIKMLFV